LYSYIHYNITFTHCKADFFQYLSNSILRDQQTQPDITRQCG